MFSRDSALSRLNISARPRYFRWYRPVHALWSRSPARDRIGDQSILAFPAYLFIADRNPSVVDEAASPLREGLVASLVFPTSFNRQCWVFLVIRTLTRTQPEAVIVLEGRRDDSRRSASTVSLSTSTKRSEYLWVMTSS